jgi:cyclophilin family peptidyl-prolyl cis-trans isomerase
LNELTGRFLDGTINQAFLKMNVFFKRYFEAETNPRIKHTKKGLVSMVNCGDNMLGSQFFFTLGTATSNFM